MRAERVRRRRASTGLRALGAAAGLIASLAGGGRTAWARMAPTTLKQLAKEAEIVVVAAPKTLTRDDPTTVAEGSGHAELVVLETLRGQVEPTIRLDWGSEVHDQPIDTLADRRLLFLKKGPDGRLVAAHYGVSYWPLMNLRDVRTDKYDWATYAGGYPAGNVQLRDEGIVGRAFTWAPLGTKETQVDVVFLAAFKRWLQRQK
jgi:hypothetical protein